MFFTITRDSQSTRFGRRAGSHAVAVIAGIAIGQMLSGGALDTLLRNAFVATIDADATRPSEQASPRAVVELQPVVKPVDVTIRDIEQELRRAP